MNYISVKGGEENKEKEEEGRCRHFILRKQGKKESQEGECCQRCEGFWEYKLDQNGKRSLVFKSGSET